MKVLLLAVFAAVAALIAALTRRSSGPDVWAEATRIPEPVPASVTP
jgi:hypothetical protein